MGMQKIKFSDFSSDSQVYLYALGAATVGVWLFPVVMTIRGGEGLWSGLLVGSLLAAAPCWLLGKWFRSVWQDAEKSARTELWEAEQRKQEERLASDERRRARVAEQEARQRAIAHLEQLPSSVVHAYQHASNALAAAEQCVLESERHRANGAATPFWENVEQSLHHMALHREAIAHANSLVAELQRGLATAAERYPDVGISARLPWGLDGLARIAAHDKLRRDIDAITYEAQCNRDFAFIYEQRRTTAAVYEGFNSIRIALNSLGDQITSLSNELREATYRVPIESRSPGDQLVFLADPNSLTGQVGQINQALQQIASSR